MLYFAVTFLILQSTAMANPTGGVLDLINKINVLMEKHLAKETEITEQKQKLELAISNLSEEISDIDGDIKDRQHELAHKFRYILQATGTDFLRNLFEAKNAGQLERNLKFLTIFSNHDLSLIKFYKKKSNELENKKNIETQRYTVLKDLEIKIKLEDAKLKSELESKNAILRRIIKSKKSQQLYLGKLFNNALKKGDIRKAEKYSMLIGKSFIDKRGFMNWPIDGPILQKYGMIKDSEFRVHLPFKGISINTEANASVKSVAFGKIVYLSQDKDSLYTLLINHGLRYHTLYSNLTKVSVKLGDTLQEGQILGMTSKTPFYFEIREGLIAKDPAKWLMPQNIIKSTKPDIENWEKVQ